MIADGCNIKMPNGTQITPASLNQWLADNGGFKEDRNIDANKINKLDLQQTLDTNDISKIKTQLKYGGYVIAVKDSKGNWYAVSGQSKKNLIVQDPKNKRSSLNNDEFSQGIVFSSQKCKTSKNLQEEQLFFSE